MTPRVPGYAHAAYVRAAALEMLAGRPAPSIDTPTEVLAAMVCDAPVRFPAPSRNAHFAVWKAHQAYFADRAKGGSSE